MNDLILRSLRKERIERFPVWLMRQAGRYMKEYRALREKEKDFLSFCKNVPLAVKASLLPLELLQVDAIIIFSDILVPLEPMGVKVEFLEGAGPNVVWDGDVRSLKKISYNDTQFVNEIVRDVKSLQKEVPVIGFCGAPFTLLSYMVEGSSSKDSKRAKLFMWENADYLKLMELIVDNLVEYLKGQVKAGADLIQVFDSWAMHLSYLDFSKYAREILSVFFEKLRREISVPIIYFYRGSGSFLKEVYHLPIDAVSVDWTVDMVGEMSRTDKVFQGNLDPYVLYSSKENVQKKVLELIGSVPRRTGYIFNLGHGLMPDMEFEKVKLLVDTVKSLRW